MRGRAVVGCWVFVACTGTSTPGSPAPVVAVEGRTTGSDAVEVQEPEPPPAPVPLVIGWDAVPPKGTREARRLNKEALGRHKAGDWEASRAGFEAAKVASPGYAWPRFNGACAQSRLGETTAAADELRSLLLEDLPRFRRRFLDDPDLETLRGSPEGLALQELVGRIAKEYRVALARGVPAFLYEERLGEVPEDGDYQGYRIPYEDLRIGVYDHTTARFVPMVPEVADAYSGVLDRAKQRAVVATGKLEIKDMWEVQPHEAGAVLFSLENFGDALLTARQASPPGDVFYGFEVWAGADDTLYGARYAVGYANAVEYLRWRGSRPKKIGWAAETGYGYADERPPEFPIDDPSVEVVELARALYRADTKATLHRRTVGYEGVAGTVALEKGHHDMPEIYASPDPMVFIVASNTLRFTDDGADRPSPTTRERHVIDLVDMHEKTATRLALAAGYCHVAWAPDGTLFLDAPTGTRRYGPGSTEPHDDVMPGVRFGTPPFPEVGGV